MYSIEKKGDALAVLWFKGKDVVFTRRQRHWLLRRLLNQTKQYKFKKSIVILYYCTLIIQTCNNYKTCPYFHYIFFVCFIFISFVTYSPLVDPQNWMNSHKSNFSECDVKSVGSSECKEKGGKYREKNGKEGLKRCLLWKLLYKWIRVNNMKKFFNINGLLKRKINEVSIKNRFWAKAHEFFVLVKF